MNTQVTLSGWTLDNPVIPASGTFGYGYEFSEWYDINILGTFSFKGTTQEARFGNPTPRIADAPAGMLNAVGLQNPGVRAVIREELPKLKKVFHKKVIANVSGFSVEEYARTCALLDREEQVGLLEVNISCPNVKVGGMAYGGVTPANAAFVSSYYGMRHYAVNLSVVVTNLLFASFGSTIAGALYDATGSYLSTDAMILVLAVLSAAVSFGIDLCDRRMLKRR